MPVNIAKEVAALERMTVRELRLELIVNVVFWA